MVTEEFFKECERSTAIFDTLLPRFGSPNSWRRLATRVGGYGVATMNVEHSFERTDGNEQRFILGRTGHFSKQVEALVTSGSSCTPRGIEERLEHPRSIICKVLILSDGKLKQQSSRSWKQVPMDDQPFERPDDFSSAAVKEAKSLGI